MTHLIIAKTIKPAIGKDLIFPMTKEQLGALILDSQNVLYRVSKSLLCNDTDCADAIQEAIVHSFAKLHTLKNDQYAKTWLIRILINECYTIMRKEKKLIPLETLPRTDVYEMEDYSDLYQAVQKLPQDMRMAVVLHYVEGFSVKEIAEIQKVSESAVKNRLFSARKKLRFFLEEEEAKTV